MKLAEEKKLAGCCGVYCGLCPRYQSTAKSRCPGCKILSLTISCKLYNCCVKAKTLVTCADCRDFPCDKYERFFDWDTFVTRKVCRPNIERIQKAGLKTFLQEQYQKRILLEELLANYNDGRSRSFYCIAVALMPPALLKEAVGKAKAMAAHNKVNDSDIKAKAKILKSFIQDSASKSNIDLKLRKKPK
jgi:hypothetical protein